MSEQHEMRVDKGGGRERLMPVNYPSNSKKSKQLPPEKKVEQVTTGTVVQRKKRWSSRMGESFISEGAPSVMQYVLLEVMLPAAKNMVSDAVSQGIERMLFGDSRRGSSRSGHTNYNRVRSGTSSSEIRELSPRARANHEFDDIMLQTRAEADDVLERLRDLINVYEVATVADLYDLSGLTSSFADNKWGWYDLRAATVRNVRAGYIIQLPRTTPID